MTAPFSTPLTKKPTTACPPRRGKIKAQIFKEIAKSLASVASKAGDILGVVKKDNDRAPVVNVIWSFRFLGFVLIDPSMAAASFPAPPVKKPTTAFPARRGKIKAQIFGGIAETVVSAASRAGDFLGLKKINDDVFAPAASPDTTKASDG
ncbi:hypothetical protein QVD17_02844 [Tagetes erecta]|uniref:Uncharacterized protein n=1 Tax=Tagetes erecta TaxID=13708 RepID=A0AAD8P967_TARER|nr:hypothetical protein QVD17_02844 [Tagetes erecta]